MPASSPRVIGVVEVVHRWIRVDVAKRKPTSRRIRGRSRDPGLNPLSPPGDLLSTWRLEMSAQFDVRYTAQLARLNLSEEEIAKFQSQLGQVLDYVEKLSAVDVSGVEPTAHA